MGNRINVDTYQFGDEKEMAASLGIDLETIEGDYAEAYHRMSQLWKNQEVDHRFDEWFNKDHLQAEKQHVT